MRTESRHTSSAHEPAVLDIDVLSQQSDGVIQRGRLQSNWGQTKRRPVDKIITILTCTTTEITWPTLLVSKTITRPAKKWKHLSYWGQWWKSALNAWIKSFIQDTWIALETVKWYVFRGILSVTVSLKSRNLTISFLGAFQSIECRCNH